MSAAFASNTPSPRRELAQLRGELVILAGRLYRLRKDAAVLWSGTTLNRLLEPRCLAEGLDDWVLRAALAILVESCEGHGLTFSQRGPERALELLDQLEELPPSGGPRRGGGA